MDFQKLNEIAMRDARNALVQRFDWQAFLVYSVALYNSQNTPDIEDTEIDDNIKSVFSDFMQYYNKKKAGHDASREFSDMLISFKKIITELYYQSNAEEKSKIKDIVSQIGKL